MAPTQAVCRVLCINPLGEATCVGLNQRGTRCGCAVARASRIEAYHVLESCVGLPSRSRQLRHAFKEAAGLLLCKKWHQYQWQNIASEWLDLWQEAESAMDSGYSSNDEIGRINGRRLITYGSDNEDSVPPNARTQAIVPRGQRQRSGTRTATHRQTSRGTSLSGTVNDNSPNEPAVAALQDMLSTIQSQLSLLTSTLNQTQAETRTAATTTTTQRQSSRLPSTQPPMSQSSPSTTSPPSRTNSAQTSRSSSRPRTPSPPPPPSTTREPTTHTSTPPRPQPAPIRHSHTECPICMSGYTAGEEAEYFECTTCLNRTHLSCHRQWATIDPRTTTCTFCRAIVPAQL